LSSSNPTLTGGPNDPKVNIFVGYAHEDKRWFDQEYRFNLIPYLKESLRRDNTEFWYDKELMGGDEYKRRIDSEINKAQIALLMVSQHFLNSEFIETFELPRIAARAERKELVVIPVLVEPCAWHDYPFLADRQMVPSSSPLIHFTESEPKWADVRFEILDGLRRQVKRTRQEMQAEALRKETEERLKRERELAEERKREAERRARELAEQQEREKTEEKARAEEAARLAAEEARKLEPVERERRQKQLEEQKACEEAERKARELAEQKAREEAERKKREQQQRKGHEEKKNSVDIYALLFTVLKRILALIPLACLVLLADLVFHLWLGHAGAQWKSLNSGITDPVHAITGSPDGKTLYACGADRSFLTSTDGGGTWMSHTINEHSNCQSISVTPDGKKILIPVNGLIGTRMQTAGYTSAILSSINGGVDWQTIYLVDPSLPPVVPRKPNNVDMGIVPDSNSSGIYSFTNLQKQGTIYSGLANYSLRIEMRGIFSDGTRIMAVGDKGEIFGTKYQSTDIGAQDSGVQTPLNAVTGTPDGKFLIAVGYQGSYIETADWGITWRSDTSWRSPAGFATPDLNAVFMTADGQQICAVGNYGTVFTSSDEGAHWTIRYAGVRSNLFGVFGTANGKHLWAVGTSGMILESNDSGATWKQRPSGVNVNLYAIYGTSDGKRLWVAGDNGTILESKRSLFF
jgi:photosystem II stability/assembly factor-like uncharacterized protein